jgi:hypothetical protein
LKRRSVIIAILFSALAFLGCIWGSGTASIGAPSETVNPPPLPSATDSLPSTETSTHTPAIVPTATSTVTATPIPTPRFAITYSTPGELLIVHPHSQSISLGNLQDIKVSKNIDLGPISNVELTDDGGKIIYTLDFNYRPSLYVINSDGSGCVTLITRRQMNNFERYNEIIIEQFLWDFSLIPDTHRLLLSTGCLAHRTGGGPFYNLFTVNVDTGELFRFHKAGFGGFASPSPDGKMMTTSNYDSISLSLINGRTLFTDIITSDAPFIFNNDPKIVWTADSSRLGTLIYSHSAKMWNHEKSTAAIWIVDTSSGLASWLGEISDFGFGSLSPTLDWIGYVRRGKDILTDETIVSRVDGSNTIHLVKGRGGFISFAPDGKHYAFFSGVVNLNQKLCAYTSKTSVFIGSLEGEGATLITEQMDPRQFQWINNAQFVYIQDNEPVA